MPKAVKEWLSPAILLAVLAAVFSAGGTWAIVSHQSGQVDAKADRDYVDKALATKADAKDLNNLASRVNDNATRITVNDGRYQSLLIEVKDRLARIETKLDEGRK